MRTQSKRGLQVGQPVFNDSSAEQLVLLLNGDWGNCPNQLGDVILYLDGVERIAKIRSRGSLHRALVPDPDDDLQKVNAKLDSIQFSFRLSHTRGGWKREWRPVRRFNLGPDTYLLNLGLAMVGDLASTGELSKIRRCLYCRKWFVASRNRPDNRFCPGGGCRSEWHRKTDDGRKKRTKYMQKYRQRLADRQANELRIARGLVRSRKPGQA
jgi:hypothetical protein